MADQDLQCGTKNEKSISSQNKLQIWKLDLSFWLLFFTLKVIFEEQKRTTHQINFLIISFCNPSLSLLAQGMILSEIKGKISAPFILRLYSKMQRNTK